MSDEQQRQAVGVQVGAHPITNQLGILLTVTNGEEEGSVFISPEDALNVSTKLQANATIAMFMGTLGQMQQAQQPQPQQRKVVLPR